MPQPDRAARAPRLVRLYAELKRRRVLGSTAAYVVLAGLLIELSGAVFEALLFPSWASRLVTVLLILGLPLVVVLAWFFDVSAGRVSRTDPAPRADRAGPDGELAGALRRAHAVPVPATPLRPREPADGRGPGAGTDGAGGPGGPGDAGGAPSSASPATSASSPDPERLRQATLGHLRHELRTPINGIMGYAEMLMEDVEEPDLRADLERIRGAGRQLLGRIDALLSPDRLAPGVLEDLPGLARQVEVDLRTPVNAVLGYAEMLRESCQETGRDHLVPDIERIVASSRRLLDASGDLVGIAAAAGGGSDAALQASAAMAGGVLAKIRPVGVGEGSAEGAGRLLVVDDNETNRDLLARQLARFGYTVATAGDGKAGLELLDRQAFDLVLLDVLMPVLDGVETLRRIRSSERHRGTPVIMLSSLDETDSAVRCIEMGAYDYLSKPVHPTLLEARIAAALDLRELRRREETYRRRIAADHDLVDRLLQGAVPSSLLERVRTGDLEVEESWPGAAVVRCVLPALHRPAAAADPLAGVRRLRDRFARFEEVARTHGVDALLWRVDGFVAVLGTDGSEDPGADAARLALDTAAAALDAFPDGPDAGRAGLAIAIHAGAVVGGLVGRDRPRFEVWGDGVETAEGVAARAPAGSILITPSVRTALGDRFLLEARGVLDVPGAGQIRIHALMGEPEAEATGVASGPARRDPATP